MPDTTITVTWNDDERPEGVDAEEWAYTLRMGGIDAESVVIVDGRVDVVSDLVDELVERIRVASFETPKAGSHTEWANRLRAMFAECCVLCGCDLAAHDGELIHDDGSTEYVPGVWYQPLVGASTPATDAR